MISDIFGMNGRRILDGLVEGQSREALLGTLSAHVRTKIDRLGEALSMTLRETDRLILADLLEEHDALDRRVLRLNARIDDGLADQQASRRLLETIPGEPQEFHGKSRTGA